MPGRHFGAGSRWLELNAAPKELAFLKISESVIMGACELDLILDDKNVVTCSHDLVDLVTLYRGVILQLVSVDGVPYSISRVNVKTGIAGSHVVSGRTC